MDDQQSSLKDYPDEAFTEDTCDAFETAELMELMFEEAIYIQISKLFDVTEELNFVQWSNYTYGEGFKKLTSIVKQLNEIRANSLDLPEFIERARPAPPGRNQPNYAYIQSPLKHKGTDIRLH